MFTDYSIRIFLCAVSYFNTPTMRFQSLGSFLSYEYFMKNYHKFNVKVCAKKPIPSALEKVDWNNEIAGVHQQILFL